MLNEAPREIIEDVLSYLTNKRILKVVSLVNKQFAQVIRSADFWSRRCNPLVLPSSMRKEDVKASFLATVKNYQITRFWVGRASTLTALLSDPDVKIHHLEICNVNEDRKQKSLSQQSALNELKVLKIKRSFVSNYFVDLDFPALEELSAPAELVVALLSKQKVKKLKRLAITSVVEDFSTISQSLEHMETLKYNVEMDSHELSVCESNIHRLLTHLTLDVHGSLPANLNFEKLEHLVLNEYKYEVQPIVCNLGPQLKTLKFYHAKAVKFPQLPNIRNLVVSDSTIRLFDLLEGCGQYLESIHLENLTIIQSSNRPVPKFSNLKHLVMLYLEPQESHSVLDCHNGKLTSLTIESDYVETEESFGKKLRKIEQLESYAGKVNSFMHLSEAVLASLKSVELANGSIDDEALDYLLKCKKLTTLRGIALDEIDAEDWLQKLLQTCRKLTRLQMGCVPSMTELFTNITAPVPLKQLFIDFTAISKDALSNIMENAHHLKSIGCEIYDDLEIDKFFDVINCINKSSKSLHLACTVPGRSPDCIHNFEVLQRAKSVSIIVEGPFRLNVLLLIFLSVYRSIDITFSFRGTFTYASFDHDPALACLFEDTTLDQATIALQNHIVNSFDQIINSMNIEDEKRIHLLEDFADKLQTIESDDKFQDFINNIMLTFRREFMVM